MKVLTRILAVCFFFIVLVFAGFQAQRLFSPAYRTETALSYTAADEVHTIGLALRNETVLDVQKSNVVGYLYEDGSKVSKNTMITEIYQDRSAIEMKAELERIEQEIQMLQDAQSTGQSFVASTDALNAQLTDVVQSISQYSQQGDCTHAGRQPDELPIFDE